MNRADSGPGGILHMVSLRPPRPPDPLRAVRKKVGSRDAADDGGQPGAGAGVQQCTRGRIEGRRGSGRIALLTGQGFTRVIPGVGPADSTAGPAGSDWRIATGANREDGDANGQWDGKTPDALSCRQGPYWLSSTLNVGLSLESTKIEQALNA